MFKSLLILTVFSSLSAWAGDVCTFDADGRCEEGETDVATLQPATSIRYGQYGAIVAGLSNGDPQNGVPARVATGAAAGRTANEAVTNARIACEAQTIGYDCKLIKVFSDGCWYVANGTRGTQARYAAGTTWEGAIASCESGGFTCKTKQVGICVGNDIEEDESDE